MRRPEVELSDAAARYVEEHPGVIEKLAKGIPDAEQDLKQQVRDRVRTRLREARRYTNSPEGEAAGAAWLAQYGVSADALR